LPSALALTLGKGCLCRVQHMAKWPKTTFYLFFAFQLDKHYIYHNTHHMQFI
jgi:hypothetical protein